MLVAAVIGAAILGSQAGGMGFGTAAVGDLAILLALYAFDKNPARSGGQSLALGAVSAFCLLTPFTFLANVVLGSDLGKANTWTLPGLWVFITLIMFAIDMFRTNSQTSVSLADSGLAGAVKPIASSAQATSYRPAPIRVDTPAPVARVETQPIAAAVMPEAVMAPVAASPVATAPIAAAAPVQPAPDVTAIPPGREAMIYLNLVGEGLNVLRTVRAENLGRDYYRIADVMPEGEQWEFTPGMVVRCRKKSLSNGKQMVAYEEAPRAV